MLFKEDFIEQCDEILNLLESDLDNEFGKSNAKTAETINNLNGQKVAKLEAQTKRTKYNTYSNNKSVAENAKKNLSRQRAELAEAKYNKKKALNTMRMIKNQNDNIANTINSSYEYDNNEYSLKEKETKHDTKNKYTLQNIDLKVNNNSVGHAYVITYDNDGEIFLSDFVIEKKYRNKGFGQHFLKLLIEKYNIQTLTVNPDNKVAVHIYDKFGFKKQNKHCDYYYDDNAGENVVYMKRDSKVDLDNLIKESEEIDMDLNEADDARIETAERQKEALRRREQDLTQKYQKEKMDIQKQRQRIQDTIDYARSINKQSEESDNNSNTVQESAKELADDSAENNDTKKLVFKGSNGDLFQYLIYRKKNNNSEINYQAIDAIVHEHDGAMYVQKLKSEINKAEPSADLIKQLKQKIINIYKRVGE